MDYIKFNYCFTCNKSFYSYSNLNKHFKTKTHNKKIMEGF
jgi:hypothetical protein